MDSDFNAGPFIKFPLFGKSILGQLPYPSHVLVLSTPQSLVPLSSAGSESGYRDSSVFLVWLGLAGLQLRLQLPKQSFFCRLPIISTPAFINQSLQKTWLLSRNLNEDTITPKPYYLHFMIRAQPAPPLPPNGSSLCSEWLWW